MPNSAKSPVSKTVTCADPKPSMLAVLMAANCAASIARICVVPKACSCPETIARKLLDVSTATSVLSIAVNWTLFIATMLAVLKAMIWLVPKAAICVPSKMRSWTPDKARKLASLKAATSWVSKTAICASSSARTLAVLSPVPAQC